MMAEAIGLAAGVMSIATLTNSSSKALYELLDGFVMHLGPSTS
jgi:hypothetical protein